MIQEETGTALSCSNVQASLMLSLIRSLKALCTQGLELTTTILPCGNIQKDGNANDNQNTVAARVPDQRRKQEER